MLLLKLDCDLFCRIWCIVLTGIWQIRSRLAQLVALTGRPKISSAVSERGAKTICSYGKVELQMREGKKLQECNRALFISRVGKMEFGSCRWLYYQPFQFRILCYCLVVSLNHEADSGRCTEVIHSVSTIERAKFDWVYGGILSYRRLDVIKRTVAVVSHDDSQGNYPLSDVFILFFAIFKITGQNAGLSLECSILLIQSCFKICHTRIYLSLK